MTPWEFQGRELVTCNCGYACPCQFNSPPDKGFCEAVAAVAIDKGHYGDVSLDGTKLAAVLHWPGPIHEGKGRCQPVVDSAANERQREALLKIMSGQDTDPFATVFAVFASTYEKVFDPIVTPITFDVDVDARSGKVRAEGVFEIDGRPIRDSITGADHRVRIDLPQGFEYEIAEIGSASSRSRGNIALALTDSYAQFARLHLNNHGVVRHRALA